MNLATVERQQNGGVAARLRVKAAGGGRAAVGSSIRDVDAPAPASSGRAMREARAKNNPRYRIGDGKGRFLACDGSCVVDDGRIGWVGFERQAENALARFPAAKGMKALRVFPLMRAHPDR